MCERCTDRRCCRFGDVEQAQPGRVLDLGLPADRISQHPGIEADLCAGPFSGRPPSRRDGFRPCRDEPPGVGAVAVGYVIANLASGQDQRHASGQPRPFTCRVENVGPPKSSQRARAGLPVRCNGRVLRFGQNRDQQAVVVSDETRVLAVQVAQGQAQAAQMRHPVPEERPPKPVPTGSDDAEHGRNMAEEQAIGNGRSLAGVRLASPDALPACAAATSCPPCFGSGVGGT